MNTQPTMPTPSAEYGGRVWRWRWQSALAPTGNTGDALFRGLLFFAALSVLVIVGVMILAIAQHSMLSIRKFGFGFLTGTQWNPVQERFGALPFIYGTIVSSILALLI